MLLMCGVTGCGGSGVPHDLGLTPIGRPLPTHLAPLPHGLSTSAGSISCQAARVTGAKRARYSVLVTAKDFLRPARTMPLRYIITSIQVHTTSRRYDTYLDSYDVSFAPLRVTVAPRPISEQRGGGGTTGILVPGALRVSKKLLVAGQNVNDYNNDPATTFAIDELPTSCEVVVRAGYRQGEAIDIPLVP